jgi:hypothetical protein
VRLRGRVRLNKPREWDPARLAPVPGLGEWLQALPPARLGAVAAAFDTILSLG